MAIEAIHWGIGIGGSEIFFKNNFLILIINYSQPATSLYGADKPCRSIKKRGALIFFFKKVVFTDLLV